MLVLGYQLFARPRTPNDNPFIESTFGIAKGMPEYPGRFLDLLCGGNILINIFYGIIQNIFILESIMLLPNNVTSDYVSPSLIIVLRTINYKAQKDRRLIAQG
jgi:hypothetical protein